MAPWDELSWLDLPRESVIALPLNTGVSLFTANPRRIGFIAGQVQSGTAVSVNMSGGNTSTNYLAIPANAGYIYIHHKDYPGLPQRQWFGFSPASTSIYVCEILLRDWPQTPMRE